MLYTIYCLEQYIFSLCLHIFWMAIKLVFKAIIYSPLLVTGYIITVKILNKNEHALSWLILIPVFSFALYQLVYFVKGLIIGLKSRKNYFWIFLFLVCVGFTCLFPVYLLRAIIKDLIIVSSKENYRIISGLIGAFFGIFIYKRYLFLTDTAPSIAYPAYSMGIALSSILP
jgi:hypothetical protein